MTRLVTLPVSAVLLLSTVAYTSADSPVQIQLAPPVEQPLFDEWNRLNVGATGGNPAIAEHEVMHFWVEGNTWAGRYDKHPEPGLGFPNPPDRTYGIFTGADATSFVCHPTFPFYPCQNVVEVVEGTTRYYPPNRPPFEVHEQDIVLRDANGHEVMWLYWVNPGNFVCPWFRTFDEALAANPFPAHGDCVFQVTSR
jgi:hypothetical protein